MAGRIFISYSHQDAQYCRELATALEANRSRRPLVSGSLAGAGRIERCLPAGEPEAHQPRLDRCGLKALLAALLARTPAQRRTFDALFVACCPEHDADWPHRRRWPTRPRARRQPRRTTRGRDLPANPLRRPRRHRPTGGNACCSPPRRCSCSRHSFRRFGRHRHHPLLVNIRDEPAGVPLPPAVATAGHPELPDQPVDTFWT